MHNKESGLDVYLRISMYFTTLKQLKHNQINKIVLICEIAGLLWQILGGIYLHGVMASYVILK